ncbi:hypothetical protein [Streptomyces spinoverrucosus]|uniref:hypothetical protein n=1 Tax=Streptomyces spinoverrucosus TaxID=284043 RepID=UPI001143E23C|nr:hypothetical protein [Streptomyces spinoverrucosus]
MGNDAVDLSAPSCDGLLTELDGRRVLVGPQGDIGGLLLLILAGASFAAEVLTPGSVSGPGKS